VRSFALKLVTNSGTKKREVNMAVITISREMGSAGDWEGDKDFVPARLIEQTGYHYIDKKFLSLVFREYGFANFHREYTSAPGFWEHFNLRRDEERAAIVDLLNRTTLALANHGNTILIGRGNFAMLQGLTDVLNVRIQADMSTRISAAKKRFGLSDDEKAAEILQKNDELRETFIQYFYKVRGDWAEGFDLVVNTSKVGPQGAVDLILTSLDRMTGHKVAGPDHKSLKPDSDIADTVATLLNCRVQH
jgi:cytidylate kinase